MIAIVAAHPGLYDKGCVAGLVASLDGGGGDSHEVWRGLAGVHRYHAVCWFPDRSVLAMLSAAVPRPSTPMGPRYFSWYNELVRRRARTVAVATHVLLGPDSAMLVLAFGFPAVTAGNAKEFYAVFL